MSLTIDHFVTRCRVPRGQEACGGLINQVARDLFPRECSRQLASRWPRNAGVYRLRRLLVRLTVSLEDLKESRLPALWTAAFMQSLTDALARPSAPGSREVVRAGSRAALLAMAITSLLAGEAAGSWELQEFHKFFDLGAAEAILGILGEEPDEMVPALLILTEQKGLDRLLAIFDDAGLDRLLAIFSSGIAARPSLRALQRIGRRILSQGLPRGGLGLADRRRALRLFLAQAGEPGPVPEGLGSPQSIFYALMCLEALLELPLPDAPGLWAAELAAAASPARPYPPEVLDLLQEVYQHAAHRPDSLLPLAQVLGELKPLVAPGEGSRQASEVRWLSSDCAGLMLLVGLLDRLRWPEAFLRGLGPQHGPRAVTYLLAGLGLALLGETAGSPDRLDPGLALFAGWLGEPDLRGFRSFLASTPIRERHELLLDLGATKAGAEMYAQSWTATCDCLAELLVREFARRLRGFQKSSRAFLVRNFLARPGRIRVEDARLSVFLPASPFQVVLHLSGMAETVEGVGWLGGRGVEFPGAGL
jgi:hypothetical protein